MFEIDSEQFAQELDAAMQAHLEWSRRILRCAVLRVSPGDDVLKIAAHTRCRFGRWFTRHRADFEALDAAQTRSLETEHQTMHDAIRAICGRVQNGQAGEAADLDVFETTQTRFIRHLAHFKTLAITRSSQIDALTGLHLRHRLEQDFEQIGKHVRRHGSVLAVMMVDVDRFKAINDRHGHAGGDTVLQHLAASLRGALRGNDLVYRYGGEEFLLLVECTLPADIEIAARRVLETVRAARITLPDGAIAKPTVTIGVAQAADGESLASIVRRADIALYRGKADGRNRHVLAAASVGSAGDRENEA